MQTIVAFSQESAARLLVAHLIAQRIDAEYRHISDTPQNPHAVVVVNPNDIDQALVLAQAFVANPNAKQYQQNAWDVGEQSQSETPVSLNLPPIASLLSTPFTSVVGLACAMVFILSWLGGFMWVREWLFIQPIEQLTESGQWWRLLTPNIIHFSAIHIIFNLLWWFVLGSKIERIFGLSTLMLLFLIASLAANLGQLWVSGPNFGGLSGVVYAVFGFVWWVGWLRPQWGIGLPKPLIGFLLVWLAIGYADILWVSMANTAHTLGLISGCVFAWLFVRLNRGRN